MIFSEVIICGVIFSYVIKRNVRMQDRSLALILLHIFLVKFVSGQYNCVDPNNSPGQCVALNLCPEIQELVKMTFFEDDLEFLRNVQCQNGKGDGQHVCCKSIKVTERTTDENEEADNLLPSSEKCGPPGFNNKIIFGQATDLGEYPWMALLEYETPAGISVDCGGSLISDRYILTAAHCVDATTIRRYGNLIGIRLGEHNITTDPDCIEGDCASPIVRIPVEEVILHEGFRLTSKNATNDIALLRLAQKVNYTFWVRPICLPSIADYEPPLVGQKVFVAGWGRTENGTNSNEKLRAGLNLSNFQECWRKYAGRAQFLSDSQFCAADDDGADACTGDSGGPLMYLSRRNWILEGIVSFGHECGKDYPGVYTKVSAFDSWIRSKIRP